MSMQTKISKKRGWDFGFRYFSVWWAAYIVTKHHQKLMNDQEFIKLFMEERDVDCICFIKTCVKHSQIDSPGYLHTISKRFKLSF